jgi:tetratricopeptide (TPR) repeat protein
LREWFNSSGPQRLWQGVILGAGTLYNIVVKLPWLVAIVVVTVLLIQGLFQRTTAIDSISVPKALAERGYTPEIAAQRLHDAFKQIALDARTFMRSPKVALRGELPSITVPTVGLSVEAVISSIRAFLGSTNRRSISGEFIVKEDLLLLRLRIDGKEYYSSLKGVPLENADELLKEAAPNILDIIQPALVAEWYVDKDPAKAFEMASDIIARMPESDDNVAYAYGLKAYIYNNRKEHAKAIVAQEKSIQLDSGVAGAHDNLGTFLAALNRNDEAIAAFRQAIRLDPKFASAHTNLGRVLRAKGKDDEAIAAFRNAIAASREAIKQYPKDAIAYTLLGFALYEQDKGDEAIASVFRQAISDCSLRTRCRVERAWQE